MIKLEEQCLFYNLDDLRYCIDGYIDDYVWKNIHAPITNMFQIKIEYTGLSE